MNIDVPEDSLLIAIRRGNNLSHCSLKLSDFHPSLSNGQIANTEITEELYRRTIFPMLSAVMNNLRLIKYPK